jgi:cell division protein FtsI/penicillin-binding protein 2
LVAATGPDIDPNLFTGPNKSKNLYALSKDTLYENKPTFDRSLQAGYPPGSTFKLLTALAAMQMGVMDEKTIFPCGGGFFIKGKELKVMVEQIRLFLPFRFPVTVSLPMHLLRSSKNIRKSFKRG